MTTVDNAVWTDLQTAVTTLRQGFSVELGPGYAVVNTPFVGPDMRSLEILVERTGDDGHFVVSDGGYVADYFFMQGRSFDHDEALTADIVDVASRMGADLEDELLVVRDDGANLRGALVALIQTTLAVPELWQRSRRRVHKPPFRETVKDAVARMDLPVQEDLPIIGKVEEHCFDLGRTINERAIAIQTLSATQRSRAGELKRMIAWDIVDVRDAEVILNPVVLLDDSSPRRRSAIGGGIIEPLRRLDSTVLRWTELTTREFAPLRELVG